MHQLKLLLVAIACFAIAVIAYNVFERSTLSHSLADFQKGEMADLNFHTTPAPLPSVEVMVEDGSKLVVDATAGKVRLINLWASWCAPCLVEMPALDQLQAKLGGDNFEVVAINVDREGVAKAREYMDNLELKHLKLYTDPSMAAAYTLAEGRLPTSHIVDKNGKVVASYLGALEWDSEEAIDLFEHLIGE